MHVQVSDRACAKCFVVEVVGKWVVDVHQVSMDGFRRFGYPNFGEFVRLFVAKYTYVGSYFKELSGLWVLCDLCENGLKKKTVKVVFMCGRGVFVISKKEERD